MDRGPRQEREQHPKDHANFLSILFFSYMVKFLRKGRKQHMDENDLTNVMENMKTKHLAEKLENCWIELQKTNKKPSLLRAITRCFGYSMIWLFSSNLIVSVVQTWTHPWALGKFVAYFEKGQTSITTSQAIFYASIMLLCSGLGSLWREHYHLLKTELGIRIESSISSLIYRKILRLDQTKNKKISTGSVITGLTKDISNIKEVIMVGIENISDVIQLIFTIYLLYQKLGVSSLSGVLIVVVTTVIQVFLARMTYASRGVCNKKSDERLAQIQEVLSSIRLVKMYGWEEFFEKRLMMFRRIELKSLFNLYTLKSLARVIGSVTGKLSHASTLLLCLWLGRDLNADVIYYASSCFHRASKALVFLPMGLQVTSEFLMASKRVNIILYAEENQTTFSEKSSTMKPSIVFKETDVEVDNIKILKNLNLELGVGLNVLIGPSGSGKTSLLKAILDEYSCINGKKNVRGTISYMAQKSWLFPSSLKQNILFGQAMDEKKYGTVLDICGLTYDISTFLLGDEVILTDCGTNLSGGQQTRINLARALYKESDIYLLDDCLASLDVNIKNHVFKNAIKGYLSNKLCLLVTHSTQFLDQADNIIIMDGGIIKYAGKPLNLPKELPMIEQNIEEEEDFEVIDQETEDNDEAEIEEDASLLLKKEPEKQENIYKEKNNTGKVGFYIYKSYFKYGGGLHVVFIIGGIYFFSELFHASGEKLLSNWLNAKHATNTTTWNFAEPNATSTIATSTIQAIFSKMPSEIYSTTSSPQSFTTTFFRNSSEVLGENITNSLLKEENVKLYYSISITFAGSLISFLGIIVCVYFGLKIARNIHQDMIYNLLNGCMRFFDTHLIGTILTRFSRDLFILDERLPIFWNGLRTFFSLAMCLSLIASIGPLFLGISLVLVVILYKITDYVLSTLRNLQRLNSSTMSPVIGHVNATLEGLSIIRTHGVQEILKDEYDKHLDLNMTSLHLKEISSRFMNFYCHTVGLFYSSLVVATLILSKGILAGDAGLLLNQTHTLTHYLEILLLLWTLMENSMTNVERILEYQKVPKEIRKKGRVIENWPSRGEIKFQNLSLSYRSDNETVLKNLDFVIEPEHKIGIVGRTGAGKSSITMTLFRLYEYTGSLMIDGVDIKTLSLEFLRSHLAIIPQDPVIYTGTLRTNIDPYEALSDEEIWKVLEIVNLKDNFKSLQENLKESNLSIGQKQLISIARALTKKTKIVILDEATANMDDAMDALIHEKINELFKSCTVITIAHKLNNVLNCDKVVVMDKGEVVEFGSPQDLLNNTGGIFYKMVNQKHSK
ncbi:ATP-binding cassette subfamily C member 4-like [Coccinella septempunctata]|uniref:ATP-binding cassette subfamily C member 4-like n=1 Tax=Coccinella septempunctata TaxID=41139 RepID=UPI001D071097|nr:ATP-binding cassette subfamily C member 4-like [Coccinella septempunctata]